VLPELPDEELPLDMPVGMPEDMPFPPNMDQMMGDLQKLLNAQSFATSEEANAFLNKLMTEHQGRIPHPEPETPLEQAMELVYQAQDELSGRRRKALARQALQLSPDCAEAYNLLAQMETDLRKQLGLLEQGVAAGERAIGAENFEKWEGMFWGMIETRPYMRCLLGVAELSWLLDDRPRSIATYQRMLMLNPGDNQGVRYMLSTCLLEENTPQARAALQTLLSAYPDDAASTWAFNRALLLFQAAGHATPQATRALKKALKANPHVLTYMLGLKPMPRMLPEYIGFGDENEAIEYVAHALPAWALMPSALLWLAQQMKV
jgi:tetratricopeptide (TPR) repeat protein